MTAEQVLGWAAAGESETLEFKRTTGERREAARTLCAMLNHRGGRVLFGVEPDGRIVGQQIGDRTVQEVAEEIGRIEPTAFPDVERVAVSAGRDVLVVTAGPGPNVPYSYKGEAFRRVGSTNVTLTRDEFNRLLLDRRHGEQRWETQPAVGWTVADLDTDEILRTVDESVRLGRLAPPSSREPAELLRGMALTRDGVLTRAAAVLFGRGTRLDVEFPQCLLRLARFRGSDKHEFLDNRQFHGHAFDLLAQAERFLRESLPIAARFDPGSFRRIDLPTYPPLALREAIANALCHRDYGTASGSVGVAIYDDRLEITSVGGLHFGLTAEALFREHESRPWNPLVAHVFHLRGVIERWGNGTLKMAELTEQAGLPRPEIEERVGVVVVRFRPAPARVLPGLDLTARQRALLDRLAAAPGGLALRELSGDVGVPAWTVKRDLAGLRRRGLVASRGAGSATRWVLRVAAAPAGET